MRCIGMGWDWEERRRSLSGGGIAVPPLCQSWLDITSRTSAHVASHHPPGTVCRVPAALKAPGGVSRLIRLPLKDTPAARRTGRGPCLIRRSFHSSLPRCWFWAARIQYAGMNPWRAVRVMLRFCSRGRWRRCRNTVRAAGVSPARWVYGRLNITKLSICLTLR